MTLDVGCTVDVALPSNEKQPYGSFPCTPEGSGEITDSGVN